MNTDIFVCNQRFTGTGIKRQKKSIEDRRVGIWLNFHRLMLYRCWLK